MKPTESADPSPESGGNLPALRGRRLGVLGSRMPETHPLDAGAGRRAVLPLAVITTATVVLVAGVARAIGEGHALFPGATVGWSLALLTGIIVGHLVALGRDRWWGGTGSGAALTLGVLLLYGWVPAGLVSLSVVSLVGAARRHRWRQGLLHGAADVLGI
ncbi:GGDEF-domain containing protein, partial [Streptomyces sp. 12297]